MYEIRLVYVYKLRDVIQEGWQRNLWIEQAQHLPHSRKCRVCWSARNYFFNAPEGKQNFFFLRDTAGRVERLARFGNQLQRAIWVILTAHGASHITMAFITWLAPREGKMNKILHCDSLPERWRWSYLALLGQPAVSRKKVPLKPYNKSFIDQACLVKMAGYWPRSFFASLWTSTSSRSINTQKRNLPNIRPSWSHTWSIIHIYFVPVIHVWLIK